jgi:hypothetical protein
MKYFIFIIIPILASCGQENEVSNPEYTPGNNYIRVADSITQARFDTCYVPYFDELFTRDTLFDTPEDFPHVIDRENDWDYMGQREIIFFKKEPIEAYYVRFHGSNFDHEITAVYYAEDDFKTVYTDSLSDTNERLRIKNRFRHEVLPVVHEFWETNTCTRIKEK